MCSLLCESVESYDLVYVVWKAMTWYLKVWKAMTWYV